MAYHGDIALGQTLNFKFTTVNTSGAPSTIGSSPTLAAYAADSTTEITAGLTLTLDFDGVSGMHHVRVDATSGNGYLAETDYQIVLAAGTVAGTTVTGYVVGSFSVQHRSAHIVDGVWDELGDSHLGAATTGSRLASTESYAQSAWATADTRLPAALSANGLIEADTLRVGGTLQTAGDVGGDTANIKTRIPAALTSDGNIKSDALRVGGTLQTGGDLATLLTTIDDFLDTEIAAILEDTGTTLDDMVDDLEGRLTAALGVALQAHALGIGRGVVDASSTTTAVIFKSINGAAASVVNDFYNGRSIVFTSGVLALQATSISDYTGASKTAAVPALTSAPAEDVTFIVV